MQMDETAHQVVLVRNEAGALVHTHEVVCFSGAEELPEDQLKVEALDAAARAHRATGQLVAEVSSKEELERILGGIRTEPGPSYGEVGFCVELLLPGPPVRAGQGDCCGRCSLRC